MKASLSSKPKIQFFNVSEIAESKRIKQLEEEATKYCELHDRNNDELMAALGLLMMHYASTAHKTTNKNSIDIEKTPVTTTIPHTSPALFKTPTPPPQQTTISTFSPANPMPIERNAMKKALPYTPCNNRSNTSKSVSTKLSNSFKPEVSNSRKSLLSSCRNILKEFLNQNNVN